MNHVPTKLHDFRNFMWLVWQHLGLPDPTPIQYDIAEYLQNAPKRCIIEAFRGVGKSYITSGFVVHQLLLDPDKKILVVSASKQRADDFSTFTQRLISDMPILQHLRPREDQRAAKVAFDVGPAKASHSPSVKSVGITGQLAGSRADIIVADDVEVPNNSATQMMREKLSEAVKEFDAVLKPDGRIIYLGTPQTEMSLYEELPNRGYEVRIWPARYPDEALKTRYGQRLAPIVAQGTPEARKAPRKGSKGLPEASTIVGLPTDPKRFSAEDLLERELSYGKSGFALQFMLDTALSDADRYPLKLSDLIIMDVDADNAPERLVWGRRGENEVRDIPNLGLNGDRLYGPLEALGERIPFTGSIMTIDPSGRGADETAFSVVKMLNGFLYASDFGGVAGGYTPETLTKLAMIAKKHKVNLVQIEANFGDGMFTELIKPYFDKVNYPVTIEEVKHSKQKELRIIDTLEPVMNQHRLILDRGAMERDWSSVQHYAPEKAPKYTLSYQLTRITKDRGALVHDDRLDALAMAVAYWVEQMATQAEIQMKDRRAELLEKEMDSFMKNMVVFGPKDTLSTTWM